MDDVTVRARQQAIGYAALIALIVGIFLLDFAHGIATRQDDVLFHPIYRVRQSLAIALSRLHEQPASGYLAHKSVVDALNAHGFAIFPDDSGVRLDGPGWEKLLGDTDRLNDALTAALHVPLDNALPPEILWGNEPGYADFLYLSFMLFGTKVQSIYYFLFTLLGTSCLCYLAQFRKSPFKLFLLALYLAEIYWLLEYAHIRGITLNAATNSRLFTGFSLLPAAHIFFLLWDRQPLGLLAAAGATVQSALLVFLVWSRHEVTWQILLIFATAAALAAIAAVTSLRSRRPDAFVHQVRGLWPVAILALFMVIISVNKSCGMDERYRAEIKNHVFWHAVLGGVLAYSPTLSMIYAGSSSDNADHLVYEALARDLTARNDLTSPIAYYHPQTNRIEIAILQSSAHYEALARSMMLRILREHPFHVIRGVYAKARSQVRVFASYPGAMLVPFALAVLSALACAAAGGFSHSRSDRRRGFLAAGIFLIFAAMTPAINPANGAMGTKFVYSIAMFLAVCYATLAAGNYVLDRALKPLLEPAGE